MLRKTAVYGLILLFLTGGILFSAKLDIDIDPKDAQHSQIWHTKPRDNGIGPPNRRAISTYTATQGTPRVISTYMTAQGTPRAISTYTTAQGTPRAIPIYTTAQGTPRAISTYTTAQGTPRAISTYTTAQGTPRAISTYTARQGSPRAISTYTTTQGTPRVISTYTTTQDTPRITRYTLLQSKPMIRHFSPTTTENDKQNTNIRTNGVEQVHNKNHGEHVIRNNGPKKGSYYYIHWYNPPNFLKFRRAAYTATFSGCEYSNCELAYEKRLATQSDAVVFDGRWVPDKLEFQRPLGQVWIFAAHESPQTYTDLGNWWTKPQWVSSFNWTMTYDKGIADVYMPYGEIRPTTNNVNRNFTEIALRKKKTALAVISHCATHSLREKYIKKLKRYIDIDVLGSCGMAWSCGKRYLHDGCFQILNSTYKFFLSFENALCDQYFTEKLFENYNYDVVLIVRGGQKGDVGKHLINGTYISTDNFKSVQDLGKYLRRLSWSLEDYVKLLTNKSNYKAEPFEVVYKRSLCDICKRMNNQDSYRKNIMNLKQLMSSVRKCRKAKI